MSAPRLQVEVRNLALIAPAVEGMIGMLEYLNRSLASSDFETASLAEAIRQLRKFNTQFQPRIEPTV
jgi:hypothetical protein